MFETLKAIAPTLIGALVPGGALLGPALNAVGSVFGIDKPTLDEVTAKLNNPITPEQQIALVNAENEFYRIVSDTFKATLLDRQDARRDQSATTSKMRVQSLWLTSFLVVISIGGLIYLCRIGALDSTEASILSMMVGAILAKWGTIIDFLFGTGIEHIRDTFKK